MKSFSQIGLVMGLMLSSVTLASYQDLIHMGKDAFQRGQFEQAAQYWDEALSDITPESNPTDYIDTSIRLSAAYQALGHVKRALKVLESAQPVADNIAEPLRQASVLMQFSDVYLAMRDFQEGDMDCNMKEEIRPNPLTRQGIMDNAWNYLEQAEQALAKIDREKYPLLWANILHKKINIRLLKAFELYKWNKKYDVKLEKQNIDKDYNNYNKSIELAKKISAKKVDAQLLNVKTSINLIQGRTQIGKFEKKFEKIKNELGSSSIFWQVKDLPDSHDKAFAFISLAKLMLTFKPSSKHEDKRELSPRERYVYYALTEALHIAKKQGNSRVIAYAKFYLAQLYQEKGRYDDAILLTKDAIFYAQNYLQFPLKIQRELSGSPELLFDLEWQLGQLLRLRVLQKSSSPEEQKTIGHAYERADKYLKQVRQVYGSLSQAFRDKVEIFYRNWADFLLLHASKASGKAKQEQLKTAIAIIESYKVAEVRNYFQNDCITENDENITEAFTFLYSHPNTAIFYPIVFEDRIELLLSSSEGIQQYTVTAMNKESLTQKVDKFTKEIKEMELGVKGKTKDSLDAPISILKGIYKILLKPVISVLKKQAIDTIIVVPDDFLRTIPFAALYDGQKFLIENYALVVVPGITMIGPSQPMSRKHYRALLAGVDFSKQINKQKRLQCVPLEISKISCVLLKDSFLVKKENLTCSPNEWKNVCKLEGKLDILKNKKFIFSNVEDRLKKTHYSIFHISTHGYFASNPNETRLDDGQSGYITMNDLKELIGVTEFRNQPIDLLTLSACETSKGSERAALGLAGVTLKAGVRSALATLWKVSDPATTYLMIEFYQQLKDNPNFSKAKALQEAQIQLLNRVETRKEKNNEEKDEKSVEYRPYEHPYYWAPFLLIGNWL